MTLLQVQGLHVRYGGVLAVRDVSFSVAPGEVLAMLGANGAGKTSTLRAVSGLERVASGHVLVDGTDVTGWAPDRIARTGVAHVPAGRGIFGSLSVHDNLLMGLYGAGLPADSPLDEAYDTFPVLQEKRATPAGTLSGGQQQQLAVARALVQQPRVLLLDEMSMGLSPLVVQDLFRVVAGLRERGLADELLDHHDGEALKVADTVVLLEQGTVARTGTPAELGAHEISETYLGGDLAAVDSAVPDHAVEKLSVSLRGDQVRALERAAAEEGTTVDELVARAVSR